jgi:outer membrane protein assembly factor BamB
LGTGAAPLGDPPVEWSETKNVKWKTPIPGKGHGSPVVWGDTIFVTTAIAPGAEGGADGAHEFAVVAVSRGDGRVLWTRTVLKERPQGRTHAHGSFASGSPVTDGENVYAYFGSYGLYCLDMKGNVRWQKRLGRMRTRMSFGEGSSPALHGDKLVVIQDHEGASFIVVLDKKTGEEVWRAERNERTSWATPLVVESGGKAQVITNATRAVRSYDLATGEILWKCGGMTANVVPTPVFADDMVFVMSGFRGSALRAIRLSEAKDDIDGTEAIVWSLDRYTPYTPSPVLHGGMLHFLQGNGAVVSCYDAKTGKEHYGRKVIEGIGTVYASPVVAGGRLYIVGRSGTTFVIAHSPERKRLARNSLDDSFTATPAIVGGDMILRGHEKLYCIAKP